MPDLLGATNPVPGYDNTNVNRNIPISPSNNQVQNVAHRIEDMFFIIREGTMSVVSEENRPALFDVVFQSIDFFRGEVEKVEADEPLSKDIDTFLSNINTLIAKIKGEEAPEEAPAPAPAAAAAVAAAGRRGRRRPQARGRRARSGRRGRQRPQQLHGSRH